MTPTPAAGRDERVLVLMPTEKDAGRTIAALAPARLAGIACRDLTDLCQELADGAGCLLLTEEAILRDAAGCLAAALRDQPAWSSIPLVVLAREGLDTGHKQDLFAGVGANITLVERPVRMRTLRSVVQAALRTRRHQYDIREALAERERQAAALRRNEAWLQTVTDSLPALVSYVDRDLRYRFANRAYVDWFGKAPDEVIGKTIRDLLGDALFEHRRPHLEAALRGDPVRLEGLTMHARLGPRETLVIYTPHREGGQVAGLFVHVVDITDQKRAERAVGESEERYRTLFESIDEGFCVIEVLFDRDGRPVDYRFLEVNPAFERQSGLQAATGKRIRELAPAHEPHWFDTYGRVARTGDPARFVNEARALGGRWFDVYAFRLGGPDSPKVAVLFTDITARRQAEERLREAEAGFRAVFESALDAILVADDDGRYVAANPAASDLLGVPHDQILGRRVADFLEPGFDFNTAWREFLDHRHERGMIRVVRPDGAVREVEYSATREMRTGQHLSVVRDVTDRKRAEAALTRQTERLRLLWESASVLLTTDEPRAMMRGLFGKIAPHFGLDTYFNFMVNENGDALELGSCLGIPEETARDIRRLEFGQAVCGNVALHRQPIAATYIQQSDDPKVQLVKSFGIRAYACHPLLAGDRLLGTLSFASRARDQFDPDELEFLATVTRYVTVACERLRLVRELRETDRRKDEFLALLAHELRNPLAPLRNGLQVMHLAGDNPEAVGRARAMMDRQLTHMVRLIDDLLDVSRISRNKMELRRSRILLSDVLGSAVETARPQVEAAGHELTVCLPPDPVYLDADLTRLAQVFANLLTNSAKYTEAGGRIWLTACRREAGSEQSPPHASLPTADCPLVEVSVRDTGIGIPAESLPRIFDMFSQVDRSLERSTGGLGIGLALVKGLVEMHGGVVTAHSDGPGRGSTFTVRLPALAGPPERLSALPTRENGHAGGPARRMLVVDDNRDSAGSMAMMLQLLGHEVATAHDGLEALARAEEFRPEVILMDVGMPRLNGYDATRRIRELPWGRDVAVVALTGWGQDGDRARSKEAGCDGHLVKPVSLFDLQTLLTELRPKAGPRAT